MVTCKGWDGTPLTMSIFTCNRIGVSTNIIFGVGKKNAPFLPAAHLILTPSQLQGGKLGR